MNRLAPVQVLILRMAAIGLALAMLFALLSVASCRGWLSPKQEAPQPPIVSAPESR